MIWTKLSSQLKGLWWFQLTVIENFITFPIHHWFRLSTSLLSRCATYDCNLCWDWQDQECNRCEEPDFQKSSEYPSETCYPLKFYVKNLTSRKLVDVHPKVQLQAHVDKVGLKAVNWVSQNGDKCCIRQQPSYFVVVPFAATTNSGIKIGIFCVWNYDHLWEANISNMDGVNLLQGFVCFSKWLYHGHMSHTPSSKSEKVAYTRRHGLLLERKTSNCNALHAWGDS